MSTLDTRHAAAALEQASRGGTWAAIRYSSETTQTRAVRNDLPDKNEHKQDVGAMCEVLVDGHFGYAATADLSAAGLNQAFERALASTRAASAHKAYAFGADRRPPVQGSYQSARTKPLAQTPLKDLTDCLHSASSALGGADAIVNRPDMLALRRKVVATVDDSIDEASADVTAILSNGQRVHVFVEHAIGSLQNPMSDAQLAAKFHGLADPVLGADKAGQLLQACWGLDQAGDVRGLVGLARP